MKKVAILSTNRADIGLLHSLLRKIEDSNEVDWHLVLSGGHFREPLPQDLYAEYTVKKIRVPISLKNETPADISDVFQEAFTKARDLFLREKYDVVLATGDRFEMYAFALAAFFLKVPVHHLHAGEETLGAIDNVFRHSMTLFADHHYCSLAAYAKRVKALNQEARNVFVVGAPSLDGLKQLQLLSKSDLETSLGIQLQSPTALVTLHPETFSQAPQQDLQQFIEALEKLDLDYVVTASNVDEGGDLYNRGFQDFCREQPKRRVFIPSLGKLRYFSALRHLDLMIGNSSSGILEAASFHLPVVNVGQRQAGRIRPKNVVDSDLKSANVVRAARKALKQGRKKFANPYQAQKPAADMILKHLLRALRK